MVTRRQRPTRNKGVYEATPFLSALNNNVGFTDRTGGNPYTLNDIRANKVAKKSGGPNQFNDFGTGGETTYRPMSADAPDGTDRVLQGPNTGTTGGGDAGEGGTGMWWDEVENRLKTYEDPTRYITNWIESLGYNVNRADPDGFTQRMQAIAAGLKPLYDLSGMMGSTGGEQFGTFLQQYMRALNSNATGAGNYADSALIDRNELGAIINGYLSGDMSALGADKGWFEGLDGMTADQAYQQFIDLLIASGMTSMSGNALQGLLGTVQNQWEEYRAYNEEPATGEPGADQNAFIRWLQNEGSALLGQFF